MGATVLPDSTAQNLVAALMSIDTFILAVRSSLDAAPSAADFTRRRCVGAINANQCQWLVQICIKYARGNPCGSAQTQGVCNAARKKCGKAHAAMARAQARRLATRGGARASSCDGISSLMRGRGGRDAAGGAGSLVAVGTAVEWQDGQCGVRGDEPVRHGALCSVYCVSYMLCICSMLARSVQQALYCAFCNTLRHALCAVHRCASPSASGA